MQGFLLSARFSLLALAFAAPSLPSVALAQRGVEIGYKDRIFEQKYVLPEGVTGVQLLRQRLQFEVTVGLPGVSGDARLIDAMGGQCLPTFMREIAVAHPPVPSPTQQALDRLPEGARVKAPADTPRPSADAQLALPASSGEVCLAQEMLFRDAFADSLSTDRQLADLARRMRSRFADDWVTPSQIRDPAFRTGAARFAEIVVRLNRVDGIDPTMAATLPKTPKPRGQSSSVVQMITELSDDAGFEEASADLTELEARTLEAARARQAGADAEAAARKAAQEAEQDRQRRDEEARRQAEAAEARLAQQRQEEASRQAAAERRRREREAFAQRDARVARQIEIDRLTHRIDLADRDIASLRRQIEARSADARSAPPFSVASAMGDVTRLQGRLAKVQAERSSLVAALGRAKGEASSAEGAPGQGGETAPPPDATGAKEGCMQGRACAVLSLTLFCRTAPQMAAILSQRPGAARKQMLNAFAASGDCRQVPAGDELQWTAPIVIIRPQGESAAELVPGTLRDGTQGVMLKDGVVPRGVPDVRDAAR